MTTCTVLLWRLSQKCLYPNEGGVRYYLPSYGLIEERASELFTVQGASNGQERNQTHTQSSKKVIRWCSLRDLTKESLVLSGSGKATCKP